MQRYEIDATSEELNEIVFTRDYKGNIIQIDYFKSNVLLYSMLIQRDFKGNVNSIKYV